MSWAGSKVQVIFMGKKNQDFFSNWGVIISNRLDYLNSKLRVTLIIYLYTPLDYKRSIIQNLCQNLSVNLN